MNRNIQHMPSQRAEGFALILAIIIVGACIGTRTLWPALGLPLLWLVLSR